MTTKQRINPTARQLEFQDWEFGLVYSLWIADLLRRIC